ncbi:MAG: hypothetical protein KDA25_13245 [Phycisphaerales bacterium]|nr:hypothetical protein [Phycisphaerales bacterium]
MHAYRLLAATVLASGLTLGASAGSHLWDFSQVFSNADGTVQFIELHEVTGANGETQLAGKSIFSDVTGNQFTFPTNLQPPTGFKYLLLATQDYADLPGAPTPDFIIPAGFFAAGGDVLRYHVYDTWSIPAGAVPLDCVHSLTRHQGAAVNFATNFAGASGSVDPCPCPTDLDGSNVVDAADLAMLLAVWGDCTRCAADFDGDGTVGAADLATMLANWGACPN